jgi:hypothetical protein
MSSTNSWWKVSQQPLGSQVGIPFQEAIYLRNARNAPLISLCFSIFLKKIDFKERVVSDVTTLPPTPVQNKNLTIINCNIEITILSDMGYFFVFSLLLFCN